MIPVLIPTAAMPKQAHGQGGSKGRGGKIYNVISNQNGTQQFAGILYNRQQGFCSAVPLLGQGLYTYLVDGGHGSFC